MTRVATFNLQQSALLNLQRSQGREVAAAQSVSTGRIANDLKGFGRAAESVTALRTVDARVSAWQEQASALAGKLEVQDAHLAEVQDAAVEARLAVQEALGMGRGDGLATRIAAAFQKAANALNGKHQGEFLFAGARLEETPFTADEMSDLTAVPATADLFHNDGLKSATRLDDAVVVQTGELASDIGGPLMEQFRRFQAFVEGPGGAFGKYLTDAQRVFLETELGGFTDAAAGVTQVMVRTGAAQKKVEDAQATLDDRALAIKGLLGDRTEVDLARAVTELNQAQLAVQATAKVFSTLKGSSLLELLR